MLRFLAHARHEFLKLVDTRPLAAPVHIIIGNEAADADSVISAVSHAWAAQCDDALQRPVTSTMPPTLHTPIISCKRVDFVLRREASLLLQQCIHEEAVRTIAGSSGVPTAMLTMQQLSAELLFVDDLLAHTALLRLLAEKRLLRITLVDHNKLTGELATAGLGDCVADIVDHHQDMGAHTHVVGAHRNISFDVAEARGVGSTCTLVAQRLLQLSDLSTRTHMPAAAEGVAEDAVSMPLTSSVARMLLGVILLDTINMNPEAKKGTREDAAVMHRLCEVIRRETGETVDTEALYHTLRTLREDPAWWASLSTHQLLAYDFKSFAWGEAAADVAAALPAPTHHSAASVPRGSLCGTFGASSLGMPVLQALQQADSTPAAEADRAASTASHASPPSASSTPSPPPQDSRRAHSDKDTPACVMLSSHVARELRAFARENSLDFLVLMSLDASLKRQLALSYTAHLCDNPAERMSREQFDAFRRALEHESSLQLRAVPLAASRSEADEVTGEPVYAYLQGNATASRKQVVPIIQHLLCSLHL